MNVPGISAQPITPPQGVNVPVPPLYGRDDDDLALGCECANPALQIDVWGREADAAQPLQKM